jgi:endonuclease/exonuclease/phosphatase (EEP) superfamily protein YafD
MLQKIIFCLGLVVIAFTLLPFYPSDKWWITSWNFPRLQILILTLSTMVLFIYLGFYTRVPFLLAIIVLGLCAIYQAIKIYPYTTIGKVEIKSAEPTSRGKDLSIIVANLLMDNRSAETVLKMISSYNPDVVCLIEPNAWWKKKLQPLEEKYQHNIFYPMEETYGMILYSKYPLVKPEIKFLSSPEIPSIHTFIEIEDGELIKLYCVHPPPPAPSFLARTSNSSEKNDAELIQIGRMVSQVNYPVVVMGDLNDVAWSETTTAFQKLSGLHDPRKGRGMFNTFHADYFFLRFPLDHVFVSPTFKLVEFKKLPYIGSDHFPFYIELKYPPPLNHTENKREEG